MDVDIYLRNVPITSLSYESRNVLSSLLNTKKILQSDGPKRLPRDWRGLACLINISSEVAASISEYPDKIGKVLEVWQQQKDDTANVGRLLQHLQTLDRYDVYDDLLQLAKDGHLVDNRIKSNHSSNGTHRQSLALVEDDSDLITFEDKRWGEPQYYDAYVLYADEDYEFVQELFNRMNNYGFKMCSSADLLPGHATAYVPVSRLISERCESIVLVLSPDFLRSPANTFFTNYAQAVGITTRKRKILPCLYRACVLPSNISFYHRISYSSSCYDFWEKLAQALAPPGWNGIEAIASREANISRTSELRITELSQSKSESNIYNPSQPNSWDAQKASSPQTNGVRPPSPPKSDILPYEMPKKKSNPVKKVVDFITGKKKKSNKKAIMLEDY